MTKTKTTREGRVNVPLGRHELNLGRQAVRAGTTKTNLARILILDGLERLETGAMVVKPASLEPNTPTE